MVNGSRMNSHWRGFRTQSLAALALFFISGFAICNAQQPTDTICPNLYELDVNGSTYKIPYCRNWTFDSIQPQAKKAVISIHGASRTAVDQYDWAVEAASLVPGASDSTIIVVPHLLIEPDLIYHGLSQDYFHWVDDGDGWKYGYDSDSTTTYPKTDRISSFAVVDSFIAKIVAVCPNLEKIVFYGHSGGGQFVGRYAAGNRIEELYHDSISFRYVVANPSTYMYFDGERRIPGSLDQFAIPDSAAIANCPNYDRYKFGLSDLDSCWYMISTTPAAITSQFEEREYVLLLGTLDNDPADTTMDQSCKAAFLGDHRLERGIIYFNYIQEFFGPGILSNHYIDTVPGVDHSAHDMLVSQQGLDFVFGDFVPNSRPSWLFPAFSASVYPNPAGESLKIGLPGISSAKITCMDSFGRKVQEWEWNSPGLTINVSDLNAGGYWLRIESAEGKGSAFFLKIE